MQGKRTFVGILLVTALLIMAQPSVSLGDSVGGPYGHLFEDEVYGGPWVPNDEDIFAMDLTLGGSKKAAFYMYDYDEGTINSLLLFKDEEFMGTTVDFTKSHGVWCASVDGNNLVLGATPEFGFYFVDDDVIYDTYYWNWKTGTSADVVRLYDPNSQMLVAVHDATRLPLPASALLLASGVVGLIAYRVRRSA